MNTINASTGYTPFMLKSAHSPRLIPPLVNLIDTEPSDTASTSENTSPESGIENAINGTDDSYMDNATDSATTPSNESPPTLATCDGEEQAQTVI